MLVHIKYKFPLYRYDKHPIPNHKIQHSVQKVGVLPKHTINSKSLKSKRTDSSKETEQFQIDYLDVYKGVKSGIHYASIYQENSDTSYASNYH